MGVSRQEYWSGLPCPPPGDLLHPGIEPTSLTSPALTDGFFTTSITWEARVLGKVLYLYWLGVCSKSLFAQIIQISSVAQSCPTLCDPMNCSTPGLPVHHHLLEFTQTHVHRISDAIQPNHPLVVPFSSCPQSLPASESFPMNQLFA